MSELKLNEIFYHYKNSEQAILKGISATFPAGKISAIIGPSGSGKTTLLSIMAGLDQPSKGDVFIDSDRLADLNKDLCRRERVTLIFQSFHLFPLLTILENVAYPMEMNGVLKKKAKERAGELLFTLGIEVDKHRRYPGNLSGGEQQRVAIARALATNAKILLADEPTGNLDHENTVHIVEILKHLAHREGYCVIIVTHDLEIARLSDQVWEMKNGLLGELMQ